VFRHLTRNRATDSLSFGILICIISALSGFGRDRRAKQTKTDVRSGKFGISRFW